MEKLLAATDLQTNLLRKRGRWQWWTNPATGQAEKFVTIPWRQQDVPPAARPGNARAIPLRQPQQAGVGEVWYNADTAAIEGFVVSLRRVEDYRPVVEFPPPVYPLSGRYVTVALCCQLAGLLLALWLIRMVR